MTIWGIADLHLSLARSDPRERFAGRWADHAERLEREWRSVVRREDLVLIPGDISMARNHRDLQPDLAWLDRLPGTKVMSAGNHDGWWSKTAKLRPMLRRSLHVVGGDAEEVQGVIVCGTRGFSAPDDPETPLDSVQNRELAALDRALTQAQELRGDTETSIIALWHYPPFGRFGQPGPAVARLESARVDVCLYGHIHAQSQWGLAIQGEVRGVRYHCVASDSLGFRPLKIL